MARKHDPLHWARKAAQHPVGHFPYQPKTTTSPNLYLYGVSKYGDALYEVNDALPNTRGFWCHEIQSGVWKPWTRYESGNRGYIPCPPPLPIQMNKVQPVHGTPRWHILTPDDHYNAQRLRIDPTWTPSHEGSDV